MKTSVSALASVLLLASSLTALAEQLPSETKPSPLVIENLSGKPMACGLLFAHWYRQDFPAVDTGSSVTLPLDLAPETETVYLLNSVNHPMSVQDLFCAASGTSWTKVTHLDYRALALQAVQRPQRVVCISDNGALSCSGTP